MQQTWEYSQPVKIIFGENSRKQVFEVAKKIGAKKAMLVCDAIMQQTGSAQELVELSCGAIVGVFSEIQPNPTVDNIDDCAKAIRTSGADYIIAMGGGSCLDCAKAAAALAATNDSITKYHATGVSFSLPALPLIALPTTAGTGSEVTAVSVVTNNEKNLKAPIVSDMFYPKYAIVDPVLTYSVPAKIAASTGMDVLSHAIEGFSSKNHQPVSDAIAIEAARLVFENIIAACQTDIDKNARNNMAQASVMAGLSFNLPKTNASHACSFVLTNKYHIPHGEACALTLDYFVRLYKDAQNGRMQSFAKKLGFENADAMCDKMLEIKKQIGLRTDLKDFNFSKADIDVLVEKSQHPNLLNTPIEITTATLYTMYESFC